MSETATPKHTNALIHEKSPYLLQHAHNPVNWLPWGEAAFEKARSEDKPIFLSSGYSTCHWCHVMERESFENEEIAAVINEKFVPIKLDREERPDVDLTYMTYVQAATGSGGWPMSVFLTPALKPFYGGTYYPPENTAGRIGFKNLLKELAKVWEEDRAGVEERASGSIAKLQEFIDKENEGQEVQADSILAKAYDELSSSFDFHDGGFGSAPKFPRPSALTLLFRGHLFFHDKEESYSQWSADMAVRTLRAMAHGGLRDHIGGGFHRYSVDTYWHIPHYEKMLYDQGQLLTGYAEGFQVTNSAFLAEIAREIAAYLKRDLRHEGGAFFSAEDADSFANEGDDHKKEGAFYVWTAAEIDEILGSEDGSIFRYAHGAVKNGNARPESDPHGELKGTNTLFRAYSIKKTAEYFKRDATEVADIIARSKARLFEARSKRARPHLDDKIITAWNGLAISGLSRAGAALGDDEMIAMAAGAAGFIHRELCDQPGTGLHRSWREGEKGPQAFAIDYACLIHGLIDLYEAGFDARWLKWAADLQSAMDDQFLDKDGAGYYSVHTDMPNAVLRIKEDYDGAEPSPNSLAASNLLRLAAFLNREDYREQAMAIFRLFGKTLADHPSSMPVMAQALDFAARGKQQIVLAGDRGSEAFKALLAVVHRRLLPYAILIHADSGEGQRWLGESNPAIAAMSTVEGKPAAYLCENYTCQAPVTEPEALEKLLA